MIFADDISFLSIVRDVNTSVSRLNTHLSNATS